MPLKTIPNILSPELLYALALMGHGDEIGKHCRVMPLCMHIMRKPKEWAYRFSTASKNTFDSHYREGSVRFCLPYSDGKVFGSTNMILVIADAHFPSSSICRSGPKELRADGLNIPDLLSAILQLFPLDQYVDKPVGLMERVPADVARNFPVPIWERYTNIINQAENKQVDVEFIERFEFYERAKRSFAVIHTGETAQYGNIILKKGLAL